MGLKMICCGMEVKRMGMLGVSVRKKKALTVNMDTVTLIGKGRWDQTCFVYSVNEINSKIFFLGTCCIFRESS
jgi:hypothetical protein